MSASKRATKANETPASISVITAEDISDYGYRNLGELLQRVVGFYVSNDQNYEHLGVRGFSRPGDFNSRVLVLVDGHRVNDPIYDEGPIGNHLPIDINDIQRVEVVRGPGSAVWGSNAVLAVINVFTKTGADLNGTKAVVDVGSFDARKGTVQYGKEFESGLDVAFSYSGSMSDGQDSFYYPAYDDGGVTSDGVVSGLDDEKFHHGYFSAAYEGWKILLISGSRRKVVPTASYGTLLDGPNTFTVDDSVRAQLSYEDAIESISNGTIFGRVGFDDIRYHGQYDYSDTSSLNLYRDRSTSKRVGGELRVSGDIFNNLTITTGVEGYSAFSLKNSSWNAVPQFALDSETDNSLHYLGGYLEGAVTVLPKLKVFLGGRLDNYSSFGKNFSPRVGGVYSATEDLTLKAQYGNAFRAPNDYELNFESASIAPNPSLDPETLDNYEFMLEYRASPRLNFSSSVFYYELQNLISQEVGSDSRTIFINGSDVSAIGAELVANYEMHGFGRGFAGLSYVETDSEQGQLSNSPRALGTLGININLPGDKYSLAPQCRFMSRRRTVVNTELPSVVTCDTALRYQQEGSPFEALFGLYNIFDRDMYSVAANEHLQDRIPNYGRQWRLALTYKF